MYIFHHLYSDSVVCNKYLTEGNVIKESNGQFSLITSQKNKKGSVSVMKLKTKSIVKIPSIHTLRKLVQNNVIFFIRAKSL